MHRALSIISGLALLCLAGSVQARFSVPMVPLGDPRLSDPFEVSCAESGTGRWVDTRIWVYDFTRDLPAGIRCTLSSKAKVTLLWGKGVASLSGVETDRDQALAAP